MIQLPTTFDKHGYQFEQIARNGSVALYKRHLIGSKSPKNQYEVIRISSHGDKNVKIKDKEIFYPSSETYPSSSTWGTMGLTPFNEEQALSLYQEWVGKYSHISTEIDIAGDQELKKRGRKAVDVQIKLPVGDFSIQQIAETHKITPSVAYLRVKGLVSQGLVKISGKKPNGGRGKPTLTYCSI